MRKRWHSHSNRESARYNRYWWTRYHGTPEGHDADGRYVRGDEREVGAFTAEIMFLRKGHGIGFDLNVDTLDIKLGLYAGRLFTVWLKAERWRPVLWIAQKVLPRNPQYGFCEERVIKAKICDGLVSLRLWREPNCHRSGDRRDILWNWKTWMIGQPTYEKTVLEEGTVLVPMPEGTYPATYELAETTHVWPRFRRRQTTKVGVIRIEDGNFVPGKGENSWDCGDDMIMSMFRPATTKEQLIGAYVEAVLTRRDRYSGTHLKLTAPTE